MSAEGEFNPDGPGTGEGWFGLDCDLDGARVWLVPVPWEATASYGRGTAQAPARVRRASQQVDLHDPHFGDAWRAGLAELQPACDIAALGRQAEAVALGVIDAGGGGPGCERVDALSARVHGAVQAAAQRALERGRVPAVLGGDHSSPIGLHRAVLGRFPDVGFLHIDAHADLRVDYLGFRDSHASVMHRALEAGLGRLVGVGYRDLGQSEFQRIADDPRVVCFFDHEVSARAAQGQPWTQTVSHMVAALPPQVHISLDIDGLDPALCPHTGTPVPGGLDWGMLTTLLARVSAQRTIVGFDLCEVGAGPANVPRRDDWDAIVGARVLYKLFGAAVRSGPSG